MNSLGVGIIGSGGAAKDLAEAIDKTDGVHLVAAFDVATDRARDIAVPRGAAVPQSLDELLKDPAIDIAYIAVPHHLLASTARLALEAGKHTLVEKPMAITLDDIAQLDDIATSRSLCLGVMYVVRQAPSTRLAREIVLGGAIGEIRQVRMQIVLDKPEDYWFAGPNGHLATNWRSQRSEAGGGIVLMNASHSIDAVRYITGLEFDSGFGSFSTTTPGIDVEDSGAAVFRLSNGGVASLVAAAHSPGAREQENIQFDGSLGRIDIVGSPRRNRIALHLRRSWQNYPSGRAVSVTARPRAIYAETLQSFAAAARSGDAAPIGAADAWATLAVVLAAYNSAHSGSAALVEKWLRPTLEIGGRRDLENP